jgi:hypothetical protein
MGRAQRRNQDEVAARGRGGTWSRMGSRMGSGMGSGRRHGRERKREHGRSGSQIIRALPRTADDPSRVRVAAASARCASPPQAPGFRSGRRPRR